MSIAQYSMRNHSVVWFVLALFIVGAALGLIPVLGAIFGWLLGIIGGVISLYCLAGMIVHLLLYFNVIR